MRCFLCDRNSGGLSYYLPDHTPGVTFHEMNGDIYCSECLDSIEDALYEFHLDESGEDDE